VSSPPASKRALLFSAIAVGVLGAAVYLAYRQRTIRPLANVPLAQRPLPARREPAKCKRIAAQYTEAVNQARACSADSDCRVEARTALFATLDGCYRISNRLASMAEADRLAEAWLAGSCVEDLPGCERAPAAACRRGLCAERPAPGIPDDWRRERVPGVITMFLPPDLQRVPTGGDDSIELKYEGSERTLTLEFGEYASDPSRAARLEDAPTDKGARPQPVDVGGQKVELYRYPIGERPDQRRWAAHARVPNVSSRLSILAGPANSQLSFGLDCGTSSACDVAPLILATIEPLTQVL